MKLVPQLVSGLNQDLGVAHFGEWPCRIAKRSVCSAICSVANFRAHQPEYGPNFLHGLSRLVNRFVFRLATSAGQLVERPSNLLAHDAPQIFAERFVGLDFEGHAIASSADRRVKRTTDAQTEGSISGFSLLLAALDRLL